MLRWTATSSSMSAGATRQRASGRRRSAPSPEHGASTTTWSNAAVRSGGATASATTAATVSASPKSTVRRATIQSGYDSRVATSGHSGGAVDSFRNTALTNGLVPRGASSTVSWTAAWGGTAVNNNW